MTPSFGEPIIKIITTICFSFSIFHALSCHHASSLLAAINSLPCRIASGAVTFGYSTAIHHEHQSSITLHIMADPITIIGAIGAIAGIIDVTCRVISNIKSYHSRHNFEDSIVILDIMSQLEAFKISLGYIRDRLRCSSHEQGSRPFSSKLDIIIECCETLVAKIHNIVLDLGVSPELDLSATSRFDERRKELFMLQGMIDRQTTALTLLITASNL